MEQLQKVLSYRFWILVGLVPILSIIGWQVGAANMKSAFESRTSALENTFKGIEGLSGNAQHPNPQWKKKIDEILSKAEKDRDETWQALYDQQKDLFQWHNEEIARALAGINLDQGEEIDQTSRDVYAMGRYYDQAFSALEAKLGAPPPTFAPGILAPYRRVWDTTPSTRQIVQAQEDMWVLSLLLEIIHNTNAGHNEFTAPIREVRELQIADGVKRSSQSGGGGAGGQGQGQFGSRMQSLQQGLSAGGQPTTTSSTGGTSTETLAEPGRYVNDPSDPNAKYKRIRFRLLLLMRHEEVPRLLVEMLNHPVPISITALRVDGPDFVNQPGRTRVPETSLPDVALVEVIGNLDLFKRPPEPESAAAPGGPAQPAQQSADLPAAPAATQGS